VAGGAPQIVNARWRPDRDTPGYGQVRELLYVPAMRIGLVTPLLVLVSGCSLFMHSMERPTATVRNVSVSSAGFRGVTGQLQVDVMNPNAFNVPLSGIDWQLSIGGARAVTGQVQLSQNIPAEGVSPITTALSIGTADALMVAAALGSGAHTYELDAKFHFSTGVGQLDVEVRKSGELAM
jgi:LEA14-like dessication related protein